MFLATSLSRPKAVDFAQNVVSTTKIDGVCGPRVRVLFELRFGPTRCMHANYIAPGETQVKGEAELLFPPYSAFEVTTAARLPQTVAWANDTLDRLTNGLPPCSPVTAPSSIRRATQVLVAPDLSSPPSGAHGFYTVVLEPKHDNLSVSETVPIFTWH